MASKETKLRRLFISFAVLIDCPHSALFPSLFKYPLSSGESFFTSASLSTILILKWQPLIYFRADFVPEMNTTVSLISEIRVHFFPRNCNSNSQLWRRTNLSILEKKYKSCRYKYRGMHWGNFLRLKRCSFLSQWVWEMSCNR